MQLQRMYTIINDKILTFLVHIVTLFNAKRKIQTFLKFYLHVYFIASGSLKIILLVVLLVWVNNRDCI